MGVYKEKVLDMLGCSYVPVILDEAQAGLEIAPFFPASEGKELRPLLNGLMRCLGNEEFEKFHFIFTGTGLSMMHRHDLLSAVGKPQADEPLNLFQDYEMFTPEQCRNYVEKCIGMKAPEAVDGEWWWLQGRPRFSTSVADHLVRLGGGETPLEGIWAKAIRAVKEQHTSLSGTSPGSLLHKLLFLPQDDVFEKVVESLKTLLLARFFLGRPYLMPQGEVDLVNLGFCYLVILLEKEEDREYQAVELAEPLAAEAARTFLFTKKLWTPEAADEQLLLQTPFPSSQGFLWELCLKENQRKFLEGHEKLAEHPLLKAHEKYLPEFLSSPAEFVELHENGTSCKPESLLPQVHSPGRGALEFVRNPDHVTVFMPEPDMGPDVLHFFKLGTELGVAFIQVKFQKNVGPWAEAWSTVFIDGMYKKSPDRRRMLVKALHEKNVRIMLHMLVIYPDGPEVQTFPQRQSPRNQDGFKHLKVAVTANNALDYFEPEHLRLLRSLKDWQDLPAGRPTKKMRVEKDDDED